MNCSLIARNRIDLLRAFLILICAICRQLIATERNSINIISKREIKFRKYFRFSFIFLNNYLSTISFQFWIFEKNFLPLYKVRLYNRKVNAWSPREESFLLFFPTVGNQHKEKEQEERDAYSGWKWRGNHEGREGSDTVDNEVVFTFLEMNRCSEIRVRRLERSRGSERSKGGDEYIGSKRKRRMEEKRDIEGSWSGGTTLSFTRWWLDKQLCIILAFCTPLSKYSP